MIPYAPMVAVVVTLLFTTVILRTGLGKKVQDVPNARSLHVAPIPRIGGLGIMAGLLCGWALMITSLSWWVVVPLIGLFGVSLLDDMRGLPVYARLLAHLGAAAILVGGSFLFTSKDVVMAVATFLFSVWMTNLFNFMDGSDGLAGGMALCGFGLYGTAALMRQNDAFAMLNFTIGAAALGFLFKNFHPAKVFMGDAGSIPLGFLAAAMGLWGWQEAVWSAWFPLLIFSPFIVDASVTLLKRGVRGVKITEAHREHYYQRLIQMGWGHRNVALVEYAVMLGVGVSALAALNQEFPLVVLAVWSGVYALLMLSIDVAWRRFERERNA
ncbi:MAG: glycosyltransferase family 4 protein [Deltaproteobacteria bacterium]|nr:glycosyltransferase family 4 protein [Deltaproteobacteria bacterium]